MFKTPATKASVQNALWGAFGNEPLDGPAPPPTAEALDPNDTGPQQFSTVHGVKVSKDGRVYVADRGRKARAGLHDRRPLSRASVDGIGGASRRARAVATAN